MADDGLCIYVVGEDEVHRALAMALVRRVAEELAVARDADYFEVDGALRWSGLIETTGVPERMRWSDIHADVPESHRVRLAGHIQGQPVGPGARKLRGKFVECARADRAAGMVVLLSDTDADPRLIRGARQVLDWAATQDDLPPVAIGTPHCDAEGWLMATQSLSLEQKVRLASATQVLSFNPSLQPERLTSHPNDAVTDAKRVLQFVILGAGDVLAHGRPASKPPNLEADDLAQALASDLRRLDPLTACRLAPFIADLRVAVARLLAQHLPAA